MYTCRHVEMSREWEDAIQNQHPTRTKCSHQCPHSTEKHDWCWCCSSFNLQLPHSPPPLHLSTVTSFSPDSEQTHTVTRHTTATLMSHITLLSHFTCHVQSHSLTVTRSMPLHLVSIVYPKTHDCKNKAKYKEAKSDNLQSIVKAV